ncbi:MAG: hypothetical protein H7231_06725 [Rhodoferax sp.]|nr:hypothetical protein [Actinomycetota bacterium]
MTSLPRSALLASWGGAAIAGRVGVDQAVRAIQGEDEPHAVEPVGDLPLPDCADVRSLVLALRAAGSTGLRVVLPAPGDALGLPGPADVNHEALDAGECVLVVGGPPLALVPVIEEFGSAYETGHLVTWRLHATTPQRVTDVGSLAEAERALREALLEATAALEGLDVSRWRPDAAGRIGGLRSGRGPTGMLPPDCPPRSARVLDLAWRVRGIVELAREDDGGAVTGWEAGRRAQALRGLDDVGRRAVVAAINATLEPGL